MKCHIGERRSAPKIALGLVVIMLALLKDAVVAGNLAKANGEILVPMTNLVRYELHGLLNELGESKLLCMPNYAAGFCSDNSAIITSAVRIRLAIEAAFCKAERVTLAGSRTPISMRSPYSAMAAL